MKFLAIICIAVALSGCGSTRETNSDTVERYKEVTTAPDGQVTTTQGLRTIETIATSKSELDLTPPAAVTGIFGQIVVALTTGGTGSVLNLVLMAIAGGTFGHSRGVMKQSDERKTDLEELWQLHIKDKKDV